MSELNPVEPTTETIRSARLRALLRYWVEKSAGLAMPFRRQIEPIEIPGILPVVLLADITPSGARMRLLGTEATNAYGSETRNCLVASWQDSFLRVVQSARPAYATGTYLRGTELCRVETVLTPLTADGSSISQIFGGLLIRPAGRDSMIARDGSGGFIVVINDRTVGESDSRRTDVSHP